MNSSLRIEGGDKQGLGSKITRAIGNAGINAKGVSAAVIGNKFVAYISFDSEEDADKATAALNRLKVNGAPRKRSATRSAAKKPAARRTSAGTRTRARPRRR